MSIFSYQNFHLVGLKGVAMTSIAQLLLDANKNVTGSDVAQNFVTQKILTKLKITTQVGFEKSLPAKTDCVIYTAAHGGPDNPQVLAAKQKNIPAISQAEALADFFNQKQGVAVCGVGGKSTVSAMLSFICEQLKPQAFSVGVGEIIGLNKTGQWLPKSKYFIAEADEYVIDPATKNKAEIKPRFSFLKPQIIVATNLKFDHPDVYEDFTHTKKVFKKFFSQLQSGGTLIYNADDNELAKLIITLKKNSKINILSFGKNPQADFVLKSYQAKKGKTEIKFTHQNKSYNFKLNLPGEFNALNALAALTACSAMGFEIKKSSKVLLSFKSTKRRFEFLGEKNNIKYFDDYAHHPSEIEAVILALKNNFPKTRIITAFQPHTYSRTKKLFAEFVFSLAQADELILLDIFPSARELIDKSISSDKLLSAIKLRQPNLKAKNLHDLKTFAEYCKKLTGPAVLITLGAGDIYKVHQFI